MRTDEQKVDLQPYRRASNDILTVLSRFAGAGGAMEKASIDEVYLDVSAEVERRAAAAGAAQGRRWQWTGHVYGESGLAAARPVAAGSGGDYGREDPAEPALSALWGERSPTSDADSPHVSSHAAPSDDAEKRLYFAAEIAAEARAAVLAECGISCSAGVAANKTLAKLGSAMNKPYDQSVLLPRGVEAMLYDVDASSIRSLGGKVAEGLARLAPEAPNGVVSCSMVHAISSEALVAEFGAGGGQRILDLCSGVCEQPVCSKSRVESLMSAKSFSSTSDMSRVESWLEVLAADLAVRLDPEEETRMPRKLRLSWTQSGGDSEHSSTCAFPSAVSAAAIGAAALQMARAVQNLLPCHRLTLVASDFNADSEGSKKLTSFFAAGQPAEMLEQQQQQQREESQPRRPQKPPRGAPEPQPQPQPVALTLETCDFDTACYLRSAEQASVDRETFFELPAEMRTEQVRDWRRRQKQRAGAGGGGAACGGGGRSKAKAGGKSAKSGKGQQRSMASFFSK